MHDYMLPITIAPCHCSTWKSLLLIIRSIMICHHKFLKTKIIHTLLLLCIGMFDRVSQKLVTWHWYKKINWQKINYFSVAGAVPVICPSAQVYVCNHNNIIMLVYVYICVCACVYASIGGTPIMDIVVAAKLPTPMDDKPQLTSVGSFLSCSVMCCSNSEDTASWPPPLATSNAVRPS